MWVEKITISNIRSFKEGNPLSLSKGINLLVGHNNSGKSTILRSVYLLQSPDQSIVTRQGANASGQAMMELADIDPSERPFFGFVNLFPDRQPIHKGTIMYENTQDARIHVRGGNTVFPRISAHLNNFFIYPFFSKRKPASYTETISEVTQINVIEDLSTLYPQVDLLLADPEHESYVDFMSYCKDILGFSISSFSASNGKQLGLRIDKKRVVPFRSMGEGVPQIVGLIWQLSQAEGKLFLIEELENDIHPEALKKLLALIVEKSKTNQFIISTHSHIVLKYLGSASDSKIFHLTLGYEGKIPTTTIHEVDSDDPEGRRFILEDLGYDLFDFDLANGWLLLEESTAERVIREYLIPTFIPALHGKIRTLSLGGISKADRAFSDFSRLFLFLHREPIYHNKAWVMLDGDAAGANVISQLKAKYPSWSPNQFQCFSKPNFESYYPASFSDRVEDALQESDWKKQQVKKGQLAVDVISWAKQNKTEAKVAFKDVIHQLQLLTSAFSPRVHSDVTASPQETPNTETTV